MPDLPRWKFGDILERRSNVGRDRVKVMFIRFDRERRKMLGGGAVQFVGVRLDNNDRTNPKFVAVGRIDNYSLPGFQLIEDASIYPIPGGPFPGMAHGSGFYDASVVGSMGTVNTTWDFAVKNDETLLIKTKTTIE